jgi:biopolymer transport protein ExbB
MTAIGLAVAVPAVITYNLLVRRNKVINEKYRSFASDLQTFLLSSKR